MRGVVPVYKGVFVCIGQCRALRKAQLLSCKTARDRGDGQAEEQLFLGGSVGNIKS